MTLALALLLGGLVWALASTGLYTTLVGRLGPDARALISVGRPRPSGTPLPRASAAENRSERRVKQGEIVESGSWRVVVDGNRTESNEAGRRVLIDLTVKNAGDRAATLEVPATAPGPPRARPAGDDPPLRLQDTQLAEPPALTLDVLDCAGRSFGGSFIGASGESSGSYTFLAAPGDAIRLTYAFDVPASSADPLSLEMRFGADAGGARARASLDERASPFATLTPSDVGKVGGKDERVTVGNLWAFTLTGIDVGEPGSGGERTVTAHLKAENLGDSGMVAGATSEDPTGQNRDFYAVDGQGHLAYSSSDTLPTTRVPSKSTRTVDVKLQAGKDFASSGPYRFSIVVDPRRNRYAVFSLR